MSISSEFLTSDQTRPLTFEETFNEEVRSISSELTVLIDQRSILSDLTLMSRSTTLDLAQKNEFHIGQDGLDKLPGRIDSMSKADLLKLAYCGISTEAYKRSLEDTTSRLEQLELQWRQFVSTVMVSGMSTTVEDFDFAGDIITPIKLDSYGNKKPIKKDISYAVGYVRDIDPSNFC